MQVLERFLAKVVKTSTCWIWVGYSKNGRYGTIYIAGKSVCAHRASYELFIGPIPDGLEVLHSCDNTKCVNPEHLKAGTHIENMRDCVNKGRKAKTKPYKLVGINDHQKIYDLLNLGLSQRKIAEIMNVTQSRICQINRSLI